MECTVSQTSRLQSRDTPSGKVRCREEVLGIALTTHKKHTCTNTYMHSHAHTHTDPHILPACIHMDIHIKVHTTLIVYEALKCFSLFLASESSHGLLPLLVVTCFLPFICTNIVRKFMLKHLFSRDCHTCLLETSQPHAIPPSALITLFCNNRFGICLLWQTLSSLKTGPVQCGHPLPQYPA